MYSVSSGSGPYEGETSRRACARHASVIQPVVVFLCVMRGGRFFVFVLWLGGLFVVAVGGWDAYYQPRGVPDVDCSVHVFELSRR